MESPGLASRFAENILWRPGLDAAVTAGLCRWLFPLSRAWAATLAAADAEAAAHDLGLPRVPGALKRSLPLLHERQAVYRRESQTFAQTVFSGAAAEEIAAVAEAWDRAAFRLIRGSTALATIPLLNRYPPIRWEIAGARAVEASHGDRLRAPAAAFRLPDPPPPIEVSTPVRRHGRLERWLRTTSPVLGDPIVAHVYEPAEPADRPTIVFCDGLFIESEMRPDPRDCLSLLVASGFRVLRYEAPWHGRRRPDGWFGGEPVLGRAPLSLLDFFHAAPVEAGIWIAKARELYGDPVGLGGVSLGALIAETATAAASTWPKENVPDGLFLVTPAGELPRVALEGSLTCGLGFDRALSEAGWDESALRNWLSLVAPDMPPAVPGERIVAVLGEEDRLTHYEDAAALLQRWNTPENNLFRGHQGHFTANLRLLTDRRPFRRLWDVLMPQLTGGSSDQDSRAVEAVASRNP